MLEYCLSSGLSLVNFPRVKYFPGGSAGGDPFFVGSVFFDVEVENGHEHVGFEVGGMRRVL